MDCLVFLPPERPETLVPTEKAQFDGKCQAIEVVRPETAPGEQRDEVVGID
jgi:hypothetical protein